MCIVPSNGSPARTHSFPLRHISLVSHFILLTRTYVYNCRDYNVLFYLSIFINVTFKCSPTKGMRVRGINSQFSTRIKFTRTFVSIHSFTYDLWSFHSFIHYSTHACSLASIKYPAACVYVYDSGTRQSLLYNVVYVYICMYLLPCDNNK